MDNPKIQENISLKPYTSMYVGGLARYFIEVGTKEDLLSALHFAHKKNLKVFILGGGSNVIVSDRGFDGLVLHIKILGRKLIEENNEHVEYEIGAGEKWDDFVALAIQENLYGVENLSHIPGSVGASVVQNIGAYGQEVSESVVSILAINLNTLKQEVILATELQFSYRKSRLNNPNVDKGKYVVISVIFRLKKQGILNTEYNDIKKYFSEHKDLALSLTALRSAIITIRDSKFLFPDDPKKGSVGSFWNADHIDDVTYEKIITKLIAKGFEKKAQEMIDKKSVFKVAQGYKIPYGIFVEVLGFKGKVFGNAKILETHSCVINNFTGVATAQDIINISDEVLKTVYDEFGIRMKIEPELVGDFN